MCIDGVERICIIRKKFKGRGRRYNMLNVGTWCLVGRRTFETSIEGKLDKTDLLEVYSDIEKKKVMEKEVHLKEKWKQFTVFESKTIDNDDAVEFQSNTYPDLPDMNEEDYETEDDDMNKESKSVCNESLNYQVNNEEIDVDDI